MTIRQKILKAVYPAFMWVTRKKARTIVNPPNEKDIPPISFFSLHDCRTNDEVFDFNQLKGKKVLLVNTASDCGYTGQYEELESLYKEYQKKLTILAFPSNDFKDQEKASDEAIETFCKINYGVTFPLMKKSVVLKGKKQNNVFRWLTDPAQNGWNTQQPVWNFSKYLVDENGKLIRYFDPAISPLDKEIINSITGNS